MLALTSLSIPALTTPSSFVSTASSCSKSFFLLLSEGPSSHFISRKYIAGRSARYHSLNMASSRAMYTYDNNSSYTHGYPPPPSRPDLDYDDDKRPYEFDIIDSYSKPDVPSTHGTHYIDATQAGLATYPPMTQKPSFQSSRTGPSDIESSTFDGGGMGSEHALNLATEKQERLSFWHSVRLTLVIVVFIYILSLPLADYSGLFSMSIICLNSFARDHYRRCCGD